MTHAIYQIDIASGDHEGHRLGETPSPDEPLVRLIDTLDRRLDVGSIVTAALVGHDGMTPVAMVL